MTSSQMLRYRGEQRVPPLIANLGRPVPQKRRLNLRCFPPVLLQELPDQLPSALWHRLSAPARPAKVIRAVASHR
jgi:hypothetical protein